MVRHPRSMPSRVGELVTLIYGSRRNPSTTVHHFLSFFVGPNFNTAMRNLFAIQTHSVLLFSKSWKIYRIFRALAWTLKGKIPSPPSLLSCMISDQAMRAFFPFPFSFMPHKNLAQIFSSASYPVLFSERSIR